VTGDISALYDSNAFWLADFPKNLKIIVINNFGGGIFRIIPGPSTSKQRDEYFEAKHKKNVAAVANAFGIETLSVKVMEDFVNLLPDFLNPANKIQLLEVFTDAEQNAENLYQFFKLIKQ
jgi:2-succinyl-5-enolpyruvyl-6-hydroxy-3-cyclohexene-1-carboxylate synthase